MGQSNMAGRGNLEDVPALNHSDIHMWRDSQWMPAEEPLHTDKPKMAGIGLGMSFAYEAVTKMDISPVGLVPCAVGGTPLSRWMPGEDLYETAVNAAKAALEYGGLAGILWHQGEHDSCYDELSATYGERFTEMVSTLRRELGGSDVPFISGELGYFLTKREGIPYFERVNNTLRELVSVIPNYAFASADGLKDKGDSLHFDALSLREFGLRYAKAYQGVIAKNSLTV